MITAGSLMFAVYLLHRLNKLLPTGLADGGDILRRAGGLCCVHRHSKTTALVPKAIRLRN
jgi:hypothetical protein